MSTATDALTRFRHSVPGQALLSFGRIFVATFAASWVSAGMPVLELDSTQVLDWVQLAVQAGAGLVIANYFGPWETRYGLHADEAQWGRHRAGAPVEK